MEITIHLLTVLIILYPPDELPVPEPPIQEIIQVRRSTRGRHPFRTYSPHEYVLLTDGGELESYEKL